MFSSQQLQPEFNFTYSTNEFLGQGFTSQVFRGRSNITGFPLAIKIIDTSLLKDIDKKLVFSEIASMRKLRGKSPYVLNLIEVTDYGTNVFIATEQCDYDLTRVLQQGPLVERNAVELMQQIVKGYICIASHEIVHRDLKPANIFLKNNHVKIGDFGFGISLQECKSCHNVGSPLYMSPEALQHTTYSFSSDIWSLGVIYFQILFGCAPWNAENQAELLDRIMNIPITEVLKNRPISQTSYIFLQKTLNINPSERMSFKQLSSFNFKPPRPVSSMLLNQRKTIPTTIQSKQQKVDVIPIVSPKRHVSDAQRSQFYKIFSSQILLCEFFLQLYPLLTPIIRNNQNNLSKTLHKFISMLLHKIKDPKKINPLKIQNVEVFYNTHEYKSIILQITSSQNKLQNILRESIRQEQNNSQNYHKQLREQIMNMITALFLDSTARGNGILPSTSRKFLLDNLILGYELVRLSSLNDVLYFNKNSNIAAILDLLKIGPKE